MEPIDDLSATFGPELDRTPLSRWQQSLTFVLLAALVLLGLVFLTTGTEPSTVDTGAGSLATG